MIMLVGMGHALWCIVEPDCCRSNTVCAQKHPPQIAVGVNAFPRVQAQEHNPFVGCSPFVYSPVLVAGASPVVVTGAFPCGSHRSTAPLFRGAVIC